MSTNECAGCTKTLDDSGVMQCSRCTDKYHFACLNFSVKKFNSLSDTSRKSWVCPSCRCNEPKGGDNSNTPVRSVSVPKPRLDIENVTVRSKQSRNATQCTCISPESIREIIREELRSALYDQLREIKTQIATFEQSLTYLSDEYDKLQKEYVLQKNDMILMRKESDSLRISTKELTLRLRQMEQQSRASNIEINCVPEHKTEKISNLVQHLGNVIKCPVKEEDIHYCIRVAKMNSSNARPRSILVRFSSPRLRDSFLAASITFNKLNPKDKLNASHLGIADVKNSPIYVVENLTPENKSLHAAARIKAKELGFRFTWVRDGKIFLRKSPESKYILVKDKSILDNLS